MEQWLREKEKDRGNKNLRRKRAFSQKVSS